MEPPSTSEFSDGGTYCLQMLTRDLCRINTATGLYTRVLPRLSLLILMKVGYIPVQDTNLSFCLQVHTGYVIPRRNTGTKVYEDEYGGVPHKTPRRF